jgi:amino acid transporter
VVALLVFAAVALFKVAAGDAPEGSIDPALSWFSPFAVDSLSLLVLGLLTGVFIYWGWESAVNLNEETHNSNSAPGLAAVASTVILLVTYVSVTVAIVAFAGLDRIAEYEDDTALFGAIAEEAMGNELSWIVAIPVVLGLGLLLLGAVLMLVWRLMGHERFFGRRTEVVDPDVAAGRKAGVAAVPEEAV